MAKYSYTAKTSDGQSKSGSAEAGNVRELAQRLKSEGLILTRADAIADKAKRHFSFLPEGKVPIGEKMMVTRNLWIMVSTGLSLVKGFSILSLQTKSKKFKRVLLDIGQDVSKGLSMSDSLKKYPDIFSELYRSMIKVGEESGTLENVLDVLSVQLEKEKELQGKVKKALIYPVILLIVMMLVGICLAIFVLPQLNTFFKNLNAELPLTTKMILGSGDFLMKYWYFILIGVFVIFSIFTTLIKTKKGRFILDTVLLKIPFVSNLVIKTNTAALIRSLSSLLSSGVPLIRSLEITSGTVNNFYFKEAMNQASKDIEKGKKLYVSFQPYQNILPYGTIEMIEIGEETGRTSLILKKLAEFYEQEVYDIAEGLSATIEPIMIVLIGLAVGVFAISIIGPLYSTLGAVV